jgi:hypothetical protein
MTPQAFVLHWHAVARIAPPRFVPDSWLRQADVLIGKGINLEDLTLVAKWMLAELGRSQDGRRNAVAFNAASFGWVKMFGEFGASNQHENFIGRLALAEAARKPVRAPVKPCAPPARAATDEERKAAAATLERFLDEMKGGPKL